MPYPSQRSCKRLILLLRSFGRPFRVLSGTEEFLLAGTEEFLFLAAEWEKAV